MEHEKGMQTSRVFQILSVLSSPCHCLPLCCHQCQYHCRLTEEKNVLGLLLCQHLPPLLLPLSFFSRTLAFSCTAGLLGCPLCICQDWFEEAVHRQLLCPSLRRHPIGFPLTCPAVGPQFYLFIATRNCRATDQLFYFAASLFFVNR